MDKDSAGNPEALLKRSQTILANIGFPQKIEDIEERRFMVYFASNGMKEILLRGKVASVTIDQIKKGANKGEYVQLKPYPCMFNDCEVIYFIVYASGLAVIKLDIRQKAVSNEFEVHFELLQESRLKRFMKRIFRFF